MDISRDGRDSSVDVASRYGPEGPEFETRCWGRFFGPIQTGPVTQPASCLMGTGSLCWGKAAEAWRWPTSPFYGQGWAWVQLCLYLPSVTAYLYLLHVWKNSDSFTALSCIERNMTPIEYGTRTVLYAVAGVAGQNIADWHYETVLWEIQFFTCVNILFLI